MSGTHTDRQTSPEEHTSAQAVIDDTKKGSPINIAPRVVFRLNADAKRGSNGDSGSVGEDGSGNDVEELLDILICMKTVNTGDYVFSASQHTTSAYRPVRGSPWCVIYDLSEFGGKTESVHAALRPKQIR